jgi:hypothetical protein
MSRIPTSVKFTDEQARGLYNLAHVAGQTAAEKSVPPVMIVTDAQTGYKYPPVMDGPCGFGWITVRPGNSSFARWLVKNGLASKAYEGGVQIWVGAYGQSYVRKIAYAHAFSEVLAGAGIRAYGVGRLD